jgi:hypothetical protein
MGMYMENEIKKNEIKNLDMTYRCNVCNRETTNSMDEAINHMVSHGSSAMVAGKVSINEQKDTGSSKVNGANIQTSAQVQRATASQVSAMPTTQSQPQPSAEADRSAQPVKAKATPEPTKAPTVPVTN